MITYEKDGSLIKVKLEDKHVGHIQQHPTGGFHYVPLDSSDLAGAALATVAKVKKSLEQD
jgi:hypothetical protein